MIPAAALVHRSPGRVRLRMPAMRGDDDYFRTVERALAGRFGAATANSATASVLLTGRISCLDVRRLGIEQTLFDLTLPVATAAAEAPVTTATGAAVAPTADVAQAAAGILVLFALLQAARGNILAPAVTLLWYALEALRWGQTQP
jgi:hypothetical protein